MVNGYGQPTHRPKGRLGDGLESGHLPPGCSASIQHSKEEDPVYQNKISPNAGVERGTGVVRAELPGCSGWEVARALRYHPKTAHARLIAITSYDTEADMRRSAEAGFEAHLCKPCDPNMLLDLLAHQPAGS